MSNIAIFADSCSDIPKEIIGNIKILPLSFSFGNDPKEYRDDRSMSMDQFFKNSKNIGLPTTSGVKFIEAKQAFEEEIIKGNQVLAFHMSSPLSMATYNAIHGAINELKEEHPDANINAFDTLTVSLPEGLMALKAAQMVQKGYTYETIMDYFQKYWDHYIIRFFVEDLTDLKRGGRINALECAIATSLNIKPYIHINDEGAVKIMDTIRGSKKRNKLLLKALIQNADPKEPIGIVTSTSLESKENAAIIEEQIKKIEIFKEIITTEIGPVIGSHVGKGGYGITYKSKYKGRK